MRFRFLPFCARLFFVDTDLSGDAAPGFSAAESFTISRRYKARACVSSWRTVQLERVGARRGLNAGSAGSRPWNKRRGEYGETGRNGETAPGQQVVLEPTRERDPEPLHESIVLSEPHGQKLRMKLPP